MLGKGPDLSEPLSLWPQSDTPWPKVRFALTWIWIFESRRGTSANCIVHSGKWGWMAGIFLAFADFQCQTSCTDGFVSRRAILTRNGLLPPRMVTEFREAGAAGRTSGWCSHWPAASLGLYGLPQMRHGGQHRAIEAFGRRDTDTGVRLSRKCPLGTPSCFRRSLYSKYIWNIHVCVYLSEDYIFTHLANIFFQGFLSCWNLKFYSYSLVFSLNQVCRSHFLLSVVFLSLYLCKLSRLVEVDFSGNLSWMASFG